MARILFSGKFAGQAVDLPESRVIKVGSDESSCDIPIPDPSVSGEHCTLSCEEGVWWIKDLNSIDGTYVNGKSVQASALNNGDSVTLGANGLAFTFECAPSETQNAVPDAPPPPPPPQSADKPPRKPPRVLVKIPRKSASASIGSAEDTVPPTDHPKSEPRTENLRSRGEESSGSARTTVGNFMRILNSIAKLCFLTLRVGWNFMRKIASIDERKIDSLLRNITGAKLPLETGLKSINNIVVRLSMPFILLVGIILLITYLAKNDHDGLGDYLLELFAVPSVTLLLMSIAPKAMRLPSLVIETGEREKIRPEMLHLMKLFFGLIPMLVGLFILLYRGSFWWDIEWDIEEGTIWVPIVLLSTGLLHTLVCDHPGMIGIEAGAPANVMEEWLTILAFGARMVMAFATLTTGLVSVGLFILGINKIVSPPNTDYLLEHWRYIRGYYERLGIDYITYSALALVAVPIALYFLYLITMSFRDFVRAVMCLPRKLDELRRSNEDRKP